MRVWFEVRGWRGAGPRERPQARPEARGRLESPMWSSRGSTPSGLDGRLRACPTGSVPWKLLAPRSACVCVRCLERPSGPGRAEGKKRAEYGGERWYFARAQPAGEGCYCIRRRARSEGRVTNAPDERRGQRAGAVAGTSKTLETRRAHMHPLSLHKTAYTARPALRASSQS